MIRLCFMGTGSAELAPSKNNLSILISDTREDQLLLIDCSGAPVQRIAQLGFRPEVLTDIIMTHAHVDHIYALPSLVHTLWLYKPFDNQRGLTIWGEPETICTCKKLIEAFSLETKKNAVKLRWREISLERNNELLMIDNVTINSFPVSHGGIPSIGLKFIGEDGRNVVYSSDAQADEHVKDELSDKTISLIQDCGAKIEANTGHAGAKEIYKLIQGTNVQSVYLVHLPELSNQEINEIKDIFSSFNGNLTLPDDKQCIEFSI